MTPIAGLPEPRAPVNLGKALRTACEGVGISPEVFRSLLSPEDLDDIEGGDIPVETLRGYAMNFADGIRSISQISDCDGVSGIT